MTAHPASFSLDIEDWYHSQLLPAGEQHDHGITVVREGTTRILDLLRAHDVRATFFVLGVVVRDHPDLIRRMVEDGHELACHGMAHEPLWNLSPESFAAELTEFRGLVERAVGGFPVSGFRAPTFSLDRTTAWALDVLRAQGYAYDSSIFPAKVKMYGMPGAPVGIYRPSRADLARHDPEGDLVEFPVAVEAWGPLRLPVGGGFYLRALPYRVFEGALGRIVRRRPFALYLHPRECAPEQKRLSLPPVEEFISYVNLHSVLDKLERLFARFRFVPMREVLEQGGYLGARGARLSEARSVSSPP